MKIIDVTPTWEEWLPTAMLILRDTPEEKRFEAFDNLMPEFKKMAKMASAYVAKLSEIPLTDKELNDVFITALEGGSNYWYDLPDNAVECLRTYVAQRRAETLTEAVIVALNDACVLDIHDREEPEEKLGSLVKSKFGSAFRKMEEDERVEVQRVKDGSYDAGDADVIFQYLVLGEIVYG